jgi:CubicO group peptidase (beta-lactamase class C family)
MLRPMLMIVLLFPPGTLLAQPLPTAPPESQQVSVSRLARVGTAITGAIDAGDHAGAVWLVARNGRILDWQASGSRDVEASLPMKKDTIFRIYSMTKVVSSVAAMILIEEGRLRLDDEVGTYLPALAGMKVWQGGTETAPDLVATEHPITVKQLLTHTSGLIYGFDSRPIDKVYQEADAMGATSMDEFVGIAATLPLAFQPGERFAYGLGIDVIGAIVEQISGQPFEQFVRARITDPLGMEDTGFDLPPEKHSRIARIYRRGDDGTLEAVEPLADVYPSPGRGFAAGGAGLFSTASDYARFGQMLLNGGELDGVRILGRKTVELMMQNHLAHLDPPTTSPDGGDGFGLGGSVRVSVANAGEAGSVGQFGWSGAASTFFRIDPEEDLMILLLLQQVPFNDGNLIGRVSALVYASLN